MLLVIVLLCLQQGLMKQSSLDDSVGELDLTAAADDDEQPTNDMDEPPDLPRPPSPRPGTPVPNNITNKGAKVNLK